MEWGRWKLGVEGGEDLITLELGPIYALIVNTSYLDTQVFNQPF